jgi:hypothetical protein
MAETAAITLPGSGALTPRSQPIRFPDWGKKEEGKEFIHRINRRGGSCEIFANCFMRYWRLKF